MNATYFLRLLSALIVFTYLEVKSEYTQKLPLRRNSNVHSVKSMDQEISSDEPSRRPSSPKPTAIPAILPTNRPTRHPTLSPTSIPTSTDQPSRRPSSPKPTAIPAIMPTNRPTRYPTSEYELILLRQPSRQPSRRPSSIRPSLKPAIPTARPTPTFQPSRRPASSRPSFSSRPSRSPTFSPSFTPSSQPSSSAEPSTQPSVQPSTQPSSSTQPSIQPSSSCQPSTEPTTQPSSSDVPSNQPSSLDPPSMVPSVAIQIPPYFAVIVPSASRVPSLSSPVINDTTGYPTAALTLSNSPSFSPTRILSTVPSINPSISFTPSIPTGSPSSSPTRPTMSPTTRAPRTASPSGVVATTSTKRGVVSNGIGDPAFVNAVWYYNYRVRPTPGRRWATPFVPMFKTPESDFLLPIPLLVTPRFVLTFNEPDLSTSGFPMTPMEAIKYWPKVVELSRGAKIVGPALTKRYIFQWLPPFLAGNGTYIPRVDYINAHWYDLDPLDFIDHLRRVNFRFRKFIWVTEFNMADWESAALGIPSPYTQVDAVHFMNTVIPWMERTSYIYRYAVYSHPLDPAMTFSSLYDVDDNVTIVGLAFGGLLSNVSSSPSLNPTEVQLIT